MDSSREFITNFGLDDGDLKHLGFVPPEDPDDEENILDNLDEFISKIGTLLTSLLEGKEDKDILSKMAFSLQIPELKNRMLNVFGKFLLQLGLLKLQED